MAALEFNLSAEHIEQLVRDSIMKAGFGKAIEESILKIAKPGAYNNPIEEALRQYIRDVMVELLHGEAGARVREFVAAYVEREVSAEVLDKITGAAVEKIKRAAEERY